MNGPTRTWLFVPGADEAAHGAAARSGADVLIQELEDFTPPELRPKARSLAGRLSPRWRKAGALAAVRVNPLATCGRDDLAAVLAGRPDLVLMSKVDTPEQVRALAEAAPGVDLVPNVETAKGLLRVAEIARASPRVVALLVASEDMVADLGTTRSSPMSGSASLSSAVRPASRRSTHPTRSAMRRARSRMRCGRAAWATA
jgi:citrate lyase subunit beta / citryl-CoA lyase